MQAMPTAQRIAAAARQLLEAEGADAVTMRRVADVVGITPMAIYRHYPDRAGLLNVLADEGFADLAQRLAPRPQLVRRRTSTSPVEPARPDSFADLEQRFIRVFDIYLDHALENPRLFELMFLKPRDGARRFPQDFRAGASPTANPMAELLREGMDLGLFRQDEVWEIVIEMGALLQGLIMLYLGGRMSLSVPRFRGLCRRSFRRYFHGIRK